MKRALALLMTFIVLVSNVGPVYADTYGVIYTSLSRRVISATGVEYEVKVKYKPGTLPEGAELKVREIEADSTEYREYLAASKEAVSGTVTNAGFMDISIWYKGAEIEPTGEVTVEIRELGETPEGQVSVVHFAAEEPSTVPDEPVLVAEETLDEEPSEEDDVSLLTSGIENEVLEEEVLAPNPDVEVLDITVDDSITFTTDSFSIYGVIYTVDFHWDVDGEEFEFSLSGGDSISIRELLSILHVTDDAESFAKYIEDVRFSDPFLVWIGKTQDHTTAGDLIENYGLDVEYSSKLTESEIEELKSKEYEAYEWVLISVHPFETEEKLTVTMVDGEEWIIRVTDAQMKKTVISDSGETWEITVTYGVDAEIPEGADLYAAELKDIDAYYDTAVEMALANAIKNGLEVPLLDSARFFDIEIRYGGAKVEPKTPVLVDVKLVQSPSDFSSVVHFAEDGAESINLKDDEPGIIGASLNVQFETDSFSVYSVVNWSNIQTGSAQYALVSTRGPGIYTATDTSDTNVFKYALTDETSNYTLAGKAVYLDTAKDPDLVGGYVAEWGFELVPNTTDQYYIFTGEGTSKKYLTRNGTNATLTDNPSTAYTVNSTSGVVTIKTGDYYLRNTGDNPSQFVFGTNNSNNLFTIAKLDPNFEEKVAKKVSAADYDPTASGNSGWSKNDSVIIYRKVIHSDGSENLYALATDGSFVPVIDGGDSIYFHLENGKNVYWTVDYENGYIVSGTYVDSEDHQTKTRYIFPSKTDTDWKSDNRVTVTMNGMGGNSEPTYGTTIQNWDQGAYAYAGLHLDENNIAAGVSPGMTTLAFPLTCPRRYNYLSRTYGKLTANPPPLLRRGKQKKERDHMKLVTYDSMRFIVDASEDAVTLAIEANLAFLEVWKDNPPDERYEEYVVEAKKESNYTAVDLSLDTLDNLIRCKKELYSGVYGRALVFNE